VVQAATSRSPSGRPRRRPDALASPRASTIRAGSAAPSAASRSSGTVTTARRPALAVTGGADETQEPGPEGGRSPARRGARTRARTPPAPRPSRPRDRPTTQRRRHRDVLEAADQLGPRVRAARPRRLHHRGRPSILSCIATGRSHPRPRRLPAGAARSRPAQWGRSSRGHWPPAAGHLFAARSARRPRPRTSARTP